ncbi:hypothetical protein AMECASPLE_024930, partial [Ameca splendens]
VVTCPNASFTDLAEIVSRIEPVKNALIDEELSDEYQTDYDEEAVESALSDFEAFTPAGEHTDEEETAETMPGPPEQIPFDTEDQRTELSSSQQTRVVPMFLQARHQNEQASSSN